MEAYRVLEQAARHLKDRAITYDKRDGERSIEATIEAFAAITGIHMTPEQGWLFMVLLKAVRSQQGQFKADNYEDGAAYFALMCEAGYDFRTDIMESGYEEGSYSDVTHGK